MIFDARRYCRGMSREEAEAMLIIVPHSGLTLEDWQEIEDRMSLRQAEEEREIFDAAA